MGFKRQPFDDSKVKVLAEIGRFDTGGTPGWNYIVVDIVDYDNRGPKVSIKRVREDTPAKLGWLTLEETRKLAPLIVAAIVMAREPTEDDRERENEGTPFKVKMDVVRNDDGKQAKVPALPKEETFEDEDVDPDLPRMPKMRSGKATR